MQQNYSMGSMPNFKTSVTSSFLPKIKKNVTYRDRLELQSIYE